MGRSIAGDLFGQSCRRSSRPHRRRGACGAQGRWPPGSQRSGQTLHRLLPDHPLGGAGRHALLHQFVHGRRGEHAQLLHPAAEYIGVDEGPGDPLPPGAALARVCPGWLLRFYQFKADEILDQNSPNFHLHMKVAIHQLHPSHLISDAKTDSTDSNQNSGFCESVARQIADCKEYQPGCRHIKA